MKRTGAVLLALVFSCVMAGVVESQSTAVPLAKAPKSTFEVVGREPNDRGLAILQVEVAGKAGDGVVSSLPCRVYVTASNGRAVDGGGRGLYQDGRFFVDGSLRVEVPPGDCQIRISAGPNYVPLEMKLNAQSDQTLSVKASLAMWFSPEEIGWFSGDHHVHAQHDRTAEVMTSLEYAALQARANGLSFITEAGSNVDYSALERLSDAQFQMRRAPEIRPGPFVGHLNTPGQEEGLPTSRLEQIMRQPLPVQQIRQMVEASGGLVIHTHPLTPRHQIHWMGAGEYYSDVVRGRAAHALDIDSRETELLYFAGLNLGNRIAVSSYTDSALGRRSTSSPGDRRVYVWLDPQHRSPIDYRAMVDSFRSGHSVATNGGPLFGTMSIDGMGPGREVKLAPGHLPRTAQFTIDHLFPLSRVEVYCRGRRIHSLVPAERPLHWKGKIRLPDDLSDGDWLVMRIEDDQGHWCLTSPIYLRSSEPLQNAPTGDADAILFQISNATRFIELRRQFFAHVIVTVDPARVIESVILSRDGRQVAAFDPAQGQHIGPAGKLPVTEINGDYEEGWVWHPNESNAYHLQADWPISESGWYSITAKTTDGDVINTEAMFFDRDSPVSHQLSQVKLTGPDTEFRLYGYSEEMRLDEIREPFEGDHWWYPKQALFQLTARLNGQEYRLGSSDADAVSAHFRELVPSARRD